MKKQLIILTGILINISISLWGVSLLIDQDKKQMSQNFGAETTDLEGTTLQSAFPAIYNANLDLLNADLLTKLTSTDIDTLAELNAILTDVTLSADTNTNANTICSGGTTYLDGEGNCDDISSVYQSLDADLTDLADGTLSKTKVQDYSNWDTAYGWGNHTGAGYFNALADFTGTLTDTKFCTYDSVGGEIDCNSESNGNTLTQEEVEDFLGGMVTGNTETNITVTYQDIDGTLDFVVTDSWYNAIGDLPTGAISNGDTTHIATNDGIYDFVTGLGYLTSSPYGPSISVSELAMQNFGDFTCNGSTNCSLNETFLTANQTITLSGDISGSGATAITTTIGANKITEAMLKAVDSASDEECLTYETTTGDFEWQNCSPGGGGGTMTSVKEGDAQVGGSDIATIDFGSGFDVAETPDTEVNITLDFSEVAGHDNFTDFVANEHIDWTSDQGATNIDSGNYTDTDTTYTAGDHLTLTGTDIDVDDELREPVYSVYFEDPTADDDFQSVWYFENDCTVVRLWCESDQTVNMTIQEDDGSPADIETTDLVCGSTPVNQVAGFEDSAITAGSRGDLAITSVSGTPTWVSFKLTCQIND